MLGWLMAIYESVSDFFTGAAKFFANARDEIWAFLRNPTEIFNAIWKYLIDLYYEIINEIIKFIAEILKWVVGIMPDPFSSLPDSDSIPLQYISAINWVLPFDVLITCTNVLIISTGLWLTVGIITRWAKVTA